MRRLINFFDWLNDELNDLPFNLLGLLAWVLLGIMWVTDKLGWTEPFFEFAEDLMESPLDVLTEILVLAMAPIFIVLEVVLEDSLDPWVQEFGRPYGPYS